MPLYIILVLVILFILADLVVRNLVKYYREKRARKERSAILDESLNYDFSSEAKTLKRVEVEKPKSKILCVDDEEIILDSFRKILVLDGYSIDTVQSGKEALGLIQKHHYDFVFTDLKMPEMTGEEVCKAVKHIRPDIDVIIITGYATVESAVECMKYGAMDYIQKPFTEDELLEYVKGFVVKRKHRIQSSLKPSVHITTVGEESDSEGYDFAIPGGVFISKGHTWAALEQEGNVKIGLDDFARKIIGSIDSIELPNPGMKVHIGQMLFNVRKGQRKIPFTSPISGKVVKVNNKLNNDLDVLDISPYHDNWCCIIEADNLDTELKELKIGKTAVALYNSDLDHFLITVKKMLNLQPGEKLNYIGVFEKLDDANVQNLIRDFFVR